jgi:PTS system nitrogen regulatory IIA component
MARLTDLLDDDLVIENIEATDKLGVIREFAAHLEKAGRISDADELVRVLMEREGLGSTGIGDGVAIPHGKMSHLQEMIVSFGRSQQGVDFQSMDNKPVRLFFLLLAPADKSGDHLKTLARISRILKNPALRDDLLRAANHEDIRRLIREEDEKYPHIK